MNKEKEQKELTPEELMKKQEEFYNKALDLAEEHINKIAESGIPAIMALTCQAMAIHSIANAVGEPYEKVIEMIKQIQEIADEAEGSPKTE